MKTALLTRKRRSERGSAIVESVFTLLVLCLILFGLLQIFQLASAQMISDYASFRVARSAAVGFNDYFSSREGKVKAIGASGAMLYPEQSSFFSSQVHQFAYERIAIEDFMDGTRWLEYERWGGHSSKHNDYRCPLYGKDIGAAGEGSCKCRTDSSSRLSISTNNATSEIRSNLIFHHFPLNMPMRDFFSASATFDLKASSEMANYSMDYLGD